MSELWLYRIKFITPKMSKILYNQPLFISYCYYKTISMTNQYLNYFMLYIDFCSVSMKLYFLFKRTIFRKRQYSSIFCCHITRNYSMTRIQKKVFRICIRIWKMYSINKFGFGFLKQKLVLFVHASTNTSISWDQRVSSSYLFDILRKRGRRLSLYFIRVNLRAYWCENILNWPSGGWMGWPEAYKYYTLYKRIYKSIR